MTVVTAEDVIDFWFNELTARQWFTVDAIVDEAIQKRFAATHDAARQCELFHWRATPQGRLAEIIVLDQFSRNLFRDGPRAFYQDPLALALAQEAHSCGDDQKLDTKQRAFLYMPYMHSESPAIHEVAVGLFAQEGLENTLDFENRHKAVIDRFGRYPHRNAALGRQSTPEELAFLDEPAVW